MLAKGEETITPQVARASNSHVLRVHVHQENIQFSINQLQMCEVAQNLVNTPLFSFQDLKLSTRNIIIVLKDTLNTTSSPLPIFNPHATKVPSNTLDRHSIGSHVIDGIRNLVINSSMVKLMGSPTSNFTFKYKKGVKNTSFVDLLFNKGVVDSHSLHKISHSFPKVVPN